jgi:hypothetical protein
MRPRGSFSSDSSSERPPNNHQSTGSSPYQQRTRNLLQFLTNSGLLVERVISVLEYMKSNDINLAILIWAISWNVEDLVNHKIVVFERTSLMLSEELPDILRNWLRPPRQHSAGIRTKAARQALNEWALSTVCKAVNNEMKDLKTFLKSSPSDVSEESLLSIQLDNMVSDVSTMAPTLWYVLRHAAYTPKQDKRNALKTPETVSDPLPSYVVY